MIEIRSETVEPRQVQLTIVVSPERIERAMTEVAQEVARHQRITGYRPGKVPLRFVVARVGEEPIREAAVERLTEQVVREAIRKEQVEPWAPAEAEVLQQDPLTVRALVPLAPEVRLADYAVLAIEPPVPEAIGEEDVEAVIDGWRRDHAAIETVDRPAEPGDSLSLSLVGRVGEETVFEDEALELALTADGAREAALPNEIVDALTGVSAEEDREFVLRYSAFWPDPDLRERDVRFTAHVHGVLGQVLPPLDDDLAKELAGLGSVEELRARVREQLETRAILENRDAYVRSLVDALVSASDVVYPPIALEQEVAREMAALKQRVERQGFTWERWLELQDRDMEKLWEEMEPLARARLRQRFALGEFVRVEKIRVSKGEIDAEVERLQRPFSRDARRSLPSVEELRHQTGSRMLSDRALDRLMEVAARYRDQGASPDQADEPAAATEDSGS